MLVFDRLHTLLPTSIHSVFFVPAGLVVNNAAPTVGGGQPLLWQHLFWFYSHPAVYIMLLPAMGMVSDMLACMCRKPVFGYKPM
ncbi:MAG: cbb3-type cytochrome c oxidase subunit I, partial [Planctomycetaceae bacterium]